MILNFRFFRSLRCYPKTNIYSIQKIIVSKASQLCQTHALDIPSGSIIFCDMDGTLVDTDEANFRAYLKAVQEATNGMGVLKPTGERLDLERLTKQLQFLTSDELDVIRVLKAQYYGNFLDTTKLNDRLVQIISEHRLHSKIILVSGCKKARVEQVLKHHNIFEYFTRFICREALIDENPVRKYETAIKLIAADPNIVFVFENDKLQAQHAKHAGIPKKNIHSCPL